ncbi:hypothetical protein C8F01DRAFT_1097977, partial [Mycena amicta]
MNLGRVPTHGPHKCYNEFNARYQPLLRRFNRSTFTLRLPNDQDAALAADQVQMVVNHAARLQRAIEGTETITGVDPIGYREVIDPLNSVASRTGFGFPRLSTSVFGTIVPAPPGSRCPTLEEFLVRAEDIRPPDDRERLQHGYVQMPKEQAEAGQRAFTDKVKHITRASLGKSTGRTGSFDPFALMFQGFAGSAVPDRGRGQKRERKERNGKEKEKGKEKGKGRGRGRGREGTGNRPHRRRGRSLTTPGPATRVHHHPRLRVARKSVVAITRAPTSVYY